MDQCAMEPPEAGIRLLSGSSGLLSAPSLFEPRRTTAGHPQAPKQKDTENGVARHSQCLTLADV
jgi:hypothetical protein